MDQKTNEARERKPTCVVLDTNQWRDSLLLRRPLGAALRYYIHIGGAKLGLPEVIEAEVGKHLLKIGTDASASIKANYDTVAALTGSHPPFRTPSEEEITGSIQHGFTELDDLLVRVPMTLEQARAALERVNAEVPPNGPRNQQFKDSLIWEAVLELAKTCVVHFVTADNDFREAGGGSNQLARYLREECEGVGADVRIYAKLADCLEALQDTTPDLDYTAIAHAVDDATKPLLGEYAAREGLRVDVDAIKEISTGAYLTENHNFIAIEFQVAIEAFDTQSASERLRTNAFVTLQGSCSFSLETGEALELKTNRVDYYWVDDQGHDQHYTTIGLSGNLALGTPPDVRYTVRRPIIRHE